MGDGVLGRHSLRMEGALVAAAYLAYEGSRALVAGGGPTALRHARDVVSLERALHVFAERDVQQAARAVPGLLGALGFGYLTLHLAVTGAFLLWLHRSRPAAFPVVRTALLAASALALVGYLVFPTAPPRLAHIGVADAVSGGRVDLNRGLVSSVYNRYAAVPSMHAGWAVIVAVGVVRYGRGLVVRAAGVVYPVVVLLAIVATGNHFFVDAAAGAAIAGVAFVVAARVV